MFGCLQACITAKKTKVIEVGATCIIAFGLQVASGN